MGGAEIDFTPNMQREFLHRSRWRRQFGRILGVKMV